MTEHTGAKVMLVFPLDFGHRQKTVNQIFAPTRARMPSRDLILNDVSTLEPPCAIHRREPTAHVTQHSKHPAYQRRPHFAHPVWTGPQTPQHLPNQLAVVPLLVFNSLDAHSLR